MFQCLQKEVVSLCMTTQIGCQASFVGAFSLTQLKIAGFGEVSHYVSKL